MIKLIVLPCGCGCRIVRDYGLLDIRRQTGVSDASTCHDCCLKCYTCIFVLPLNQLWIDQYSQNGNCKPSSTHIRFEEIIVSLNRRMKFVSRPFLRFMRPDTAEKFLQSHFCQYTPVIVTYIVVIHLYILWCVCHYVMQWRSKSAKRFSSCNIIGKLVSLHLEV